jgi:hypothetical protein
MNLDHAAVDRVLGDVQEVGLITAEERAEILSSLDPAFPYAQALTFTESVHAHIKVEDVDQLPHDALRALGYEPQNPAHGYIKYATGAGINLIFSSIPIADDDTIAGAVTLPKPFMDHLGVDMRDESAPTHEEFQAIPERAAELGWREVPQGGVDQPVHCCHTTVKAKHWVYPPADWSGWRRPIEFAFGELSIFDQQMGCALRPIDPAHPLAPQQSCGCAGTPTSAQDLEASSV